METLANSFRMRLNARRELDKMLLEIALADGTLVQRSLIGIVGLVFIQPEDVPESLQTELFDLKQQSDKLSHMTTEEAKLFVMQLVHLRNQVIEENEASRRESLAT